PVFYIEFGRKELSVDKLSPNSLLCVLPLDWNVLYSDPNIHQTLFREREVGQGSVASALDHWSRCLQPSPFHGHFAAVSSTINVSEHVDVDRNCIGYFCFYCICDN